MMSAKGWKRPGVICGKKRHFLREKRHFFPCKTSFYFYSFGEVCIARWCFLYLRSENNKTIQTVNRMSKQKDSCRLEASTSERKTKVIKRILMTLGAFLLWYLSYFGGGFDFSWDLWQL